MKIVSFLESGYKSHGIIEGERIEKVEGSIVNGFTPTGEHFLLSDIDLLSPVEPGKMIAIGLNYKKHAEEVNKPLPNEPLLFLVSPTAVIGTGESILLVNPEHRNEHEGELAIIMGKTAENVSVEEAHKYVFGYTCSNDVSDRSIQKRDGQYTRAKSFPTYKPLGPVIATDIDPDNVNIKVTINGETKQDSNTNDMIFSTAAIISFVSHVMRLEPGDVILTGTPSGVSPLKDGDIVNVEIEGIGSLSNKVLVK